MKIQISLSARATAPKIGFRSKVQVALFTEELAGQISDGMWENAKPKDHWEVPSEAKAFVVKNDSDLGPNFSPMRGYNFASSQLIEWVGDRMIATGKKFDKAYDLKKLKADLKDMTAIFNKSTTHTAAPATGRKPRVPRDPNAAPRTPRVPRDPNAPRGKGIKGSSAYTWYKFTGAGQIDVSRRGSTLGITKGMEYGLRPSSDGKNYRLILRGAETIIYSLTPNQGANLVMLSKLTK